MSIDVNLQNIGTTPSRLGTRGAGRRSLVIRNPSGSGASIHIGDEDVTAATALFVVDAGGPTLTLGASFPGDPLGASDWYAATASGTSTGVVVGEV